MSDVESGMNQCASSDTGCEDEYNDFAQVMTFDETDIATHVCDAEEKDKCESKRCEFY